MLKGYMGKILEVDLSSKSYKVNDLDEELVSLYIGGKGIGVKILYDNLPPKIDPLSKENILIFASGPLVGTNVPQSNRFVVITKSPLTGGIATSTCGGNFATKMKHAGYDFIIIRGASETPLYLEVTDEKVEFHDATNLWGKGTYETQENLPKDYGKAVIGPAGENLVRYAGIVSEERIAGRCGVGTVMGSKKLKAIIVNGKKRPEINDKEKFKEYVKKITKYKTSHPMTGGILPRLGTMNLVMTTNGRNILPTMNYQKGHHSEAYKISGEELASKYLKKRGGCLSCPIRCGRVVERNGKLIKGPEYETTAALGSYIGNFDLEKLMEFNYLVDDMGIDSISCGATIAFAMELTEKGLLNSDLKFGKTDNIAQTILDIAYRRGLGNDLAEGTKRMALKYGGVEFAPNVKGLEMPAYDPRGCYGQGLEYATTNRGGCHIQGAVMYLEATGPISIAPHSIHPKPELVIMQQNLVAAICSLVMCIFTTYALIPPYAFKINPHGTLYKFIVFLLTKSGPILRKVLKTKTPFKVMWFEHFLTYVTGKEFTMGDIQEVGERIFNLERLFNLREGFTSKDDTLPERFLKESIFPGIEGGIPLDQMIGTYYKLRGWDENGVPTEETLKRLKIKTD